LFFTEDYISKATELLLLHEEGGGAKVTNSINVEEE
jgi:hypothetical protein